MIVLLAALPALAAWLWFTPVRPTVPARGDTVRESTGAGEEDQPRSLTRLLLVVLSGVGVALVVGGMVGAIAGLLAMTLARVLLARVEPTALRRRRQWLERDLPTAVGLVASCLRAGTDLDSALVLVADALGGPVCDELAGVHHRLALGMSPAQVWGDLASHPQLGPFAQTVLRSHDAGASISGAVSRLAQDLAAARRADSEAAARRVGVLAAAPLGLCFLPAFLLVGVLPMTVGLFTSMRLFG